ncbi:MAG: phenylalanine--tRNA ligase subunit beta, partial [Candidatus Lokiarchaeota archaeon]|nr:phenylalanine--tRNA ligase subunit beta [Candidatus Lokiarchaeota archaeon]
VDLTEEVAIGYGYFNIPKTIREGCIGEYHPIQTFSNKIRRIMIGAGYLEVVNFILTSSEKQFNYMKQEITEEEIVEIANPVSKEYNTTRTKLLPKLMDTLLFNRSEEKPIRIFEVGDVLILDRKEETGTKREVHLSAVSYHEDADYTELKSTLDYVMTSLGYYNDYEVRSGKNRSYIDGRYGEIYIKDSVIGEIGEIHPEVLSNFKLEFPVAAMELNTERIFD